MAQDYCSQSMCVYQYPNNCALSRKSMTVFVVLEQSGSSVTWPLRSYIWPSQFTY